MEARPWHRHYDYNVPTTIRYPRMPVHGLLQLSAGSHPDKPALNFYGSEITFWELRLQVLRMANALGRLGVRKGERVGIQLPNCPQLVIAYYATVSLGAIVVNLNPLNTADELRSMFETTGLTTLITFDGVLPAIRTVSHEMEIPRIVVTKVTDYVDGMGVSTAKDLELEEGWHHFSAIL
ncbi:MAG: AMP-binding protein, partial [Deltaproteobacteria bacterium]|nr:AMP-binding protein [Deltaproteobacteria bacterium]